MKIKKNILCLLFLVYVMVTCFAEARIRSKSPNRDIILKQCQKLGKDVCEKTASYSPYKSKDDDKMFACSCNSRYYEIKKDSILGFSSYYYVRVLDKYELKKDYSLMKD